MYLLLTYLLSAWVFAKHPRERRMVLSYEDLVDDPDGIVRVRCFPGLWIDAEALLAKDYGHLMATLEQRLATPEHLSPAASR